MKFHIVVPRIVQLLVAASLVTVFTPGPFASSKMAYTNTYNSTAQKTTLSTTNDPFSSTITARTLIDHLSDILIETAINHAA